MKTTEEKKEQNGMRPILDIQIEVKEEMYSNPKYKQPEPISLNANAILGDDMMYHNPKFLKRTHFEITGIISDEQVENMFHHAMRSAIKNHI